jgi:hypothetical protein
VPKKLGNPIKWDGTNYSIIDFLAGISKIVHTSKLGEKNEKHLDIIEKACEFGDTVKRYSLYKKENFEDLRILTWRRSLGSLEKK